MKFIKISSFILFLFFLQSCAVTPGADVGPNSEIETEINVKQVSSIRSGGSYSFESTQVGSTSYLTFIIENQGARDLILSGSPVVAISGSSDFSVVSQPVKTTLKAKESTSFQISFAPSSTSDTTASITIMNNDMDEGTYSFTLSGAGTVAPVEIPSVAVSSGVTGTTASSPVPVTFTFSKAVTGFELSDIQLSNGTASNLVETTTGLVWTADITPAASGTVQIWVNANAVSDGSNGNTVSNTYSFIYDGDAPGLTISGPSGTTNLSPFTVSFVFTEAVSGFESSDVALSNATISTLSTSDNITYTASVTPSSAGAVTIDVAANKANDGSGNPNTAATQYSVDYNNTQPSVSLTSAVGASTNGAFTVTIEFSKEVSGFDVSDISVSNGNAGSLSVVTANRKWTALITPSGASPVTVQIPANIAQDSATNNNTASGTLSVIYDTGAPGVSISGPSGPINGSFDVTITFDEDVNGFVQSDITVGNGSISNLVENTSSRVWTATISPSGSSVSVSVAAAKAQDAAGNANTVSNTYSVTYDNSAPTVSISSGESSPTNTASFTVTVAFNEDVSGFDLADITVGNGSKSNFQTINAKTYTFTLSPTSTGTVTVDVAAGVATDVAGNNNSGATQYTINYDEDSPGVSITGPSGPVNGNFDVTITFDEDVTGFDSSDITVSNGSVSNLAVDTANRVWTATISPSGASVNVSVASGKAQDNAGNSNTASNTFNITYDNSAPTVNISSSESSPTTNSSFDVTVTFNEEVTGFDLTDITVGNGSKSNFQTVNASTYTFTLSPGSTGTVTVDISAGTAADSAGNGNTVATQYSIEYTNPSGDIANLVLTEGGAEINDGDSYYIGKIQDASTKTQQFTLQNTGGADLTGIAISSSNSTEFIVSSVPSSVSASSSAIFDIQFNPSGTGTGKTSTITITSNGGTRTFTVTGNSTSTAEPSVQLKIGGTVVAEGETIDFGSIQKDTTKPITFTIRNNGSTGLIPTITVITGVANYSTSNSSFSSMAQDEENNFTITFNPAGGINGGSPFAGQINITYNLATFTFYVTGLATDL